MLQDTVHDTACYHVSLDDFAHVVSQPIYQHILQPSILGRCITVSWHTEAAYIKVREGDWKSPLHGSTGSFLAASLAVAGQVFKTVVLNCGWWNTNCRRNICWLMFWEIGWPSTAGSPCSHTCMWDLLPRQRQKGIRYFPNYTPHKQLLLLFERLSWNVKWLTPGIWDLWTNIFSHRGKKEITILPLKYSKLQFICTEKTRYISDMPNGELSFLIEFCLLYPLKTTGFAERKQVFCDHKCLPKAELGNKAKIRVGFCWADVTQGLICADVYQQCSIDYIDFTQLKVWPTVSEEELELNNPSLTKTKQ